MEDKKYSVGCSKYFWQALKSRVHKQADAFDLEAYLLTN